jgi:hypothetical protein
MTSSCAKMMAVGTVNCCVCKRHAGQAATHSSFWRTFCLVLSVLCCWQWRGWSAPFVIWASRAKWGVYCVPRRTRRLSSGKMREEHEQWEHWKATMSSYQSWERPRSHDWQHGAMTLGLANLPALLRAAGWEGQLVCRSSAAPRVFAASAGGRAL